MDITIAETLNGFIVETKGSIKNDGKYVFKGGEVLQMLEFIGHNLLDRKIEAKEK